MVDRAGLRGAGGRAGFWFLSKGRAAFKIAQPGVCPRPPALGNTEQLADVLFKDYLLPFEIASILLLVAVVGSVVMAKKTDLKMYPITTAHYIALSAALLLIGTVGVLTRRNIVIILMSIELILNAVNINLVAFSQALHNLNGQVFAIFVITDAVAEAAVGLGILIALFRNKETVLADEVDLLKW